MALLLGSDREAPAIGRTDAILLVLYNPETAKASLISIPRDLFVYIPGYSMQRINAAYELGGIELVNQTLQYNLGIQASQWAIIHLDDFSRFVDDLGGVEVEVLTPVHDPWCEVPQGKVYMNGYLALCYVRSRTGNSDLDRNRRQQEMLQIILIELVHGGNLARLPEFYTRYQDTVRSNLTLEDLLYNIPLLLQLGDTNRLSFFQLGWNDVIPWQAPPNNMSVLLPRRDMISALLGRAINFVMTPQPPSELAPTWEAELTASPTSTLPPTPEMSTPTPSPAPPTEPSITPTLTP